MSVEDWDDVELLEVVVVELTTLEELLEEDTPN